MLDFRGPVMGSLKSLCTTSYISSIETIALYCLVFEKIVFFCILATDRQTDEQMDTIDAPSRSRYRERPLNKVNITKDLGVLWDRFLVCNAKDKGDQEWWKLVDKLLVQFFNLLRSIVPGQIFRPAQWRDVCQACGVRNYCFVACCF